MKSLAVVLRLDVDLLIFTPYISSLHFLGGIILLKSSGSVMYNDGVV